MHLGAIECVAKALSCQWKVVHGIRTLFLEPCYVPQHSPSFPLRMSNWTQNQWKPVLLEGEKGQLWEPRLEWLFVIPLFLDICSGLSQDRHPGL